MNEQHPDQGFTLVEVLLVILVGGLLSAVVVASAGGFRQRAEATGCDVDARNLATAAQAYFADRSMLVIPAADASSDGYELTLVAEEMLRGPSSLYDLDELGNLVVTDGSSCTI